MAELTAIASTSSPICSANSPSNAATRGPVVSQPLRIASTTASISSSPMSGRANGNELLGGHRMLQNSPRGFYKARLSL